MVNRFDYAETCAAEVRPLNGRWRPSLREHFLFLERCRFRRATKKGIPKRSGMPCKFPTLTSSRLRARRLLLLLPFLFFLLFFLRGLRFPLLVMRRVACA